MNGLKVLVADDDPNVHELIRVYFEKSGIHMIEARDGEAAVQKAVTESPDIILLDVMMPKKDGYTVCREIASKLNIPIIMLTAKREEFDRILGLELGADDYMTKPFSPKELIARIKAIVRRMRQQTQILEEHNLPNFRVFNGLTIDLIRREVTVREENVYFRPKEFDLLVQLVQMPGQAFSRKELLEQVWGYDFFGDIRTVDVHIRKIREKLSGYHEECIQTVWGIGYKFETAN